MANVERTTVRKLTEEEVNEHAVNLTQHKLDAAEGDYKGQHLGI